MAKVLVSDSLSKQGLEILEKAAGIEVDYKPGLSEDELAKFDPAKVDTDSCPKRWKSEGEALFNLGYDSGFAGGSYSCGRCHTPGWSYGEKGRDGAGALGPNLGGVLTQFPGDSLGVTQMTDFVCNGSVLGARYGQYGQGSGRMPGFCVVPAVEATEGEVGVEAHDVGSMEQGGMYTKDQVEKIVEYVRSLAR